MTAVAASLEGWTPERDTLFLHLTPTTFLTVAADAAPGGDGHDDRPFATIQAAVEAAKPGTAILVRAGTYQEAVKFPSRAGGTPGAPIWLVSADGPGAARVIAPPGSAAAIRGLGVAHIAILGFEASGGTKGVIQFGMSGDPQKDPSLWSQADAWSRSILVRGNTVHHSEGKADGIKISQADLVQILDNTVSDCGDQCIDFVAVSRGVIAGNDCARPGAAAAVFVKGGSQDVLIARNHVHDVEAKNAAGIEMGGWSSPGVVPPERRAYEARHLTVTGNLVERVAGLPLSVLGAQDSTASGNVLDGSATAAPAYIGVGFGATKAIVPLRLSIAGNTLVGAGPKLDWLADKARDEAGETLIVPERDAIAVSGNRRAEASRLAAVGPRPFRPWSGAPGLLRNWGD